MPQNSVFSTSILPFIFWIALSEIWAFLHRLLYYFSSYLPFSGVFWCNFTSYFLNHHEIRRKRTSLLMSKTHLYSLLSSHRAQLSFLWPERPSGEPNKLSGVSVPLITMPTSASDAPITSSRTCDETTALYLPPRNFFRISVLLLYQFCRLSLIWKSALISRKP